MDEDGIRITITEQELQELREGEVFNWNFKGIDVQILMMEESDLEEDDEN